MTWLEQIESAVSELAAIPFFPAESGARFAIMRSVEQFVSGSRELRWLIDAAVNHMREWKGAAELRGLYCTRFKPLDGIEESCSLRGFTAADSEAAYLLEESDRKHGEISAARKNGLLAIEGCVDTIDPNVLQCIAERPGPLTTRPIYIPGTRKRNDDENQRLLRDLEARLGMVTHA
jgi:hypothetical protein